MKRLLKSILKKSLPYGIVTYIESRMSFFKQVIRNPCFLFSLRKILNRNKYYHNIHDGQRCFILCTGPSIKNQDLRRLKNEVVFCVSNGYEYHDYKEISPQYHCSVQFTYLDHFDEQAAIEYLREMDEKIASHDLFFNISEQPLIEKYSLFKNKKVNYVYLSKKNEKMRNEIYAINHLLPGVRSVPIMVIMIAMYMGFKEIYLLGVEHDSGLMKEKYEHAYEKESSNRYYDKHINKDNVILAKKVDIVKSRAELFLQYECLHKIADVNDIKIYNATEGGILDEFERVDIKKIKFC